MPDDRVTPAITTAPVAALPGKPEPAMGKPTTRVGVPRPQKAAETERLYAGDWAAFARWCRAAGHRPLPADPQTLQVWLAERANRPGTLGRQLAAIADRHRRHGLAVPTADPMLRPALRAARRAARSAGSQPRPAKPTPETLRRMAQSCPGDPAGRRDHALLLLAATGRFSRAALLGLDAEFLRFTESGLEIRSGDPQPTRSAPPLVLARNTPAHCPVRALEAWLRVFDRRYGPVFCKIDRWGHFEHRRLGTDALRRILARRALPAANPAPRPAPP